MRNLFGCFTHKRWEEAGADDDNKQKNRDISSKSAALCLKSKSVRFNGRHQED